MLLEGEPLIALDLESELRAEGALVHYVPNCSTALKSLRVYKIDVCVLDFIISDGDCSEVAAECRDLGVPYLITSGMPSQDELLGRAGGLEKPFGCDELVREIAQAIKLS